MSEIKEQLLVTPKSNNGMDFVTVVSVGSDATKKFNEEQESTKNGTDLKSGYVTVLKIGDDDESSSDITEEVLVYRLPGERLGFGLKFEGGTKAAEFVNRLFIQSCAPDSPASMVQCSWGKLTEGDEVLKIDSQSVTSMTRIDCVRCLKDSNVVIKLLVRHCTNKKSDDTVDGVNSSSRLIEDLPHVIGAEKKRTPPPPPPVPPRKVPRRILKDPNPVPVNNVNTVTETDTVGLQNVEQLSNGTKYNCFQSPRNSGKFLRKSPEVSRHMYKDRRLSDGSIGPPDAEVYLDLFSQEPGCNLSESDDTGSSISTIIDRLSSFPTTSNSSFAGSLPSTPTSIQKHLDVSITFDAKEIDSISRDNYWYTQLGFSQNSIEGTDGLSKNGDCYKRNGENADDEGSTLQPPMNFQDAPLSYGNEDVGIQKNFVKRAVKEGFIQYNHIERVLEIEDENGNCIKDFNNSRSAMEEVASIKITDNNVQNLLHPLALDSSKTYNRLDDLETDAQYLTEFDLPRLVYFMPKLNSNTPGCEIACTSIESVKLFLENEIRTTVFADGSEKGFLENSDIYNSELYNLSWNISSQLDTIGEDDEEGTPETASLQSSTPIVIIENADVEINEEILERIEVPDGAGTTSLNNGDKQKTDLCITENLLVSTPSSTNCETMDVPPSSSRQPPDGDEFPDYHETTSLSSNSKELNSNRVTPTWSHKLWNTSPSYNLFRDQQSSCSVRDKIAIFSNATAKQSQLNALKKSNKSTDDIPSTVDNDSELAKLRYPFNKVKRSLSTSCKSENNNTRIDNQETRRDLRTCVRTDAKVRSSLDLSLQPSHSRCMSEEKFDDVVCTPAPRLHVRSQSLMDISSTEKIPKKDRWSLLAEHRQRSLSKLKGLIIPERVVEVDAPAVLDLPEIKSNSISTTINENNSMLVSTDLPIFSCQRNANVPSLSSPPWSSKLTSSIPKYSPAFKRKSLQLQSESFTKLETDNKTTPNKILSESNSLQTIDYKKSTIKQHVQNNLYDINSKMIVTHLSDAPKSLESITSPTRSDYSFEYVSPSPESKLPKQQNYRQESNKEKSEVRKSDDDSDNDSAVSSSQSSYVSRTTPPSSPSHLYSNYSSTCAINGNDTISQLKSDDAEFQLDPDGGDNQNHRLLKPQSVEAINRQNILASAKCRSGRDLKIGSPLIQRRFEEDQKNGVLQNGIINMESKQTDVTTAEYVPSENNIKSIETQAQDKFETDKLQTSLKIKQEPADSGCVPEKPCLTENSVETTVCVKSTVSKKDLTISGGIKDKKIQDVKLSKSAPSPSVNNLRKSFEKLIPTPLNTDLQKATNLPSSAIERSNKTENHLVNTSVVKSQDLRRDSGTPLAQSSSLDETIILRPEFPGGSVGITLAGGADYETKEITVHKIRDDSSAYRDGRLHKGDIVLAINGKTVQGLTHKQLVTLLKEPVPEVTLVVCKTKNCDITATGSPSSTLPSTYKHRSPIIELRSTSATEKHKTFLVPLMKDISGLGLSLEGGQDSLLGSKPLLIKKIFKGGAAEKTGKLQVGDEILFVNETDVSSMSRFEAWSILKKLPENITISLTMRRLDMP